MSHNYEDDARMIRREEGRKSFRMFVRLYLSQHFGILPSKAHEAIYALLDQCIKLRGSKIVIAAPRGFGKTTLITLAYIIYCVCYKKEPYIMILSHGKSQACQILENVKREFETNLKLLADFPELLGAKPWNHEQIQTLNGVRVAAFGHEQSIRGRKHGQYRPSLVIADDLEKADLGFNPETKAKLKAWYEQAALEIGNSETNYMLIGNFYHPECLIGEFINDQKYPNWIKKVYPAIVSWPNNTTLWDFWRKIYNSREAFQGAHGPAAALAYYEANKFLMDEGAVVLWPDRWTLYQLMEMHENNPIAFSAEYQNQPLNPMECYFGPDEYTYLEDKYKNADDFVAAERDHIDISCGCDPSMGRDKTRGDYTALAFVARDRRDGRLYHILSDISRIEPHEAIERILAYHKRFRLVRLGIEANQFQALMAREFKRRCAERHFHICVKEFHNIANKVSRIQSLQPLMKSGLLVLNKANILFNNELRYFPKGKYDDGLDALEMAIRLAEDRRITAEIIGRGDDDLGTWMSNFRGRGLRW